MHPYLQDGQYFINLSAKPWFITFTYYLRHLEWSIGLSSKFELCIYIRWKKRREKDNYLPRYLGGRIFPESQPSCESLVPFVSPLCTVTWPSFSDGRLLCLCKCSLLFVPHVRMDLRAVVGSEKQSTAQYSALLHFSLWYKRGKMSWRCYRH